MDILDVMWVGLPHFEVGGLSHFRFKVCGALVSGAGTFLGFNLYPSLQTAAAV